MSAVKGRAASASAKRLALDGAPFARATLRPAHESPAFFPLAISSDRDAGDIHRAHAEQEPAAHLRKRVEAFAVEEPHPRENQRPYDQYGNHILRQRMLLL
jgi:hypothetical protein